MTTALISEPQLRIETPAGTAQWRPLEWDTAQFGIPAARLDRLDASGPYAQSRAAKLRLLNDVLSECRAAGVRHVTARVDAGDFSAIHALEDAGFQLIDGIQTFRLALDGAVLAQPPGTRLYRPDDLPDILEIARTAFVYDRFHADCALAPGAADRVNETWTRNCCLGSAADGVIVAEEDSRVASYVTCRLSRTGQEAGPTGTIILVATAEWARGRGAARRATAASLAWFAAQGMRAVEVGTQLRNVPAARLYENAGFRFASASLTFRKLL